MNLLPRIRKGDAAENLVRIAKERSFGDERTNEDADELFMKRPLTFSPDRPTFYINHMV